MPYSQLHRMAKEMLDSSAHHYQRKDDDFSKLVWENEQILMQGQSNKTRKSPFNTNTSLTPPRKEEEHVFPTLKTTLNDFSSSGQSSRHTVMGQDDELVHWLNYPLDDYSSEFFSEFNQNMFSAPQSGNAVQVIKNISYGGAREGPDLTRIRGNQNLTTPHRSRVQDLVEPTTTKVQQQEPEPTQPNNNAGIMNFSHFLRPATLVKTNRPTADGAPGSLSLSVDKFRSNDKTSIASSSNRLESTVIEYTNGSRSCAGHESKPNSLAAKVDLKSSTGKPPKEPFSIAQSQVTCREDAFGRTRSPDQALAHTSSFAASVAVGRPDNDKYAEPVVASSSVCSGNSAREASNVPNHRFKRKSRDTEESDYPSEDVEEESLGLRKSASARGGTSTKRSRAAEVHNLSERKRRDRINEKMRSLQELIPNCNKVDKASMLDEAIEYLKTLQLQVQIMSMSSGLFMPPMMLPNGMQHINTPHMPPFSSMSAGMGMGMGFGMGMLDMIGASSGCPLIQVPPMHGAQFPYSPISGPSSLPMMTGPSLQMFAPPGQGIPVSMPRTPFIPHSGGPSTEFISLPVVPGVATPTEGPNIASSSRENIDAQIPNTNAECLENQIASQGTKEGFKQSDVAQRHDHPPQSSGNGVIDTT